MEDSGKIKSNIQSNLSDRLAPDVEEGLYQIAREALNNIIKHAHAKNIQINFKQEASVISMQIVDDGIGFDPEIAYREGCLGLSTMHERARLQGWHFHIESRPGNGTRVIVETNDHERNQKLNTDVIRVLIVDDHAIIRKGLRAVLDLVPDIDLVGEAENGEQAVKLDLELVPDVILMDLMMPEMDGIACIKQIKTQRPKARILVLTNFAGEEMIFPAIKAGAMGYHLKVSSPEVLIEAILGSQSGSSLPVSQHR